MLFLGHGCVVLGLCCIDAARQPSLSLPYRDIPDELSNQAGRVWVACTERQHALRAWDMAFGGPPDMLPQFSEDLKTGADLLDHISLIGLVAPAPITG